MNFVKKVNTVFKYLPDWMLLAEVSPSTRKVRLSNGSEITAISTSPTAGRSEALSLLIVDEAAHIHDFDTIWIAL